MKKFFLLSFLPTHVDFALLVLRLGLGLSMFLLHGWGKLTRADSMFNTFADPLGIGSRASYVLAAGGESVGALMVALGLFARFGAVWLGVVMGVAFFMAHGGKLVGQGNGELPMIYLIGLVTLLIAGPGRFSFDAKMGGN